MMSGLNPKAHDLNLRVIKTKRISPTITEAKAPAFVAPFQYIPIMIGADQIPKPPKAKRISLKMVAGRDIPKRMAMTPIITVTIRERRNI